jgi:NH3-dependent NAD+ synthetase
MIKTYSDLQDRLVVNPNKVIQGINNHFINLQNKLKKDGVLIGLSGGIDSTVVTALCVKALGNKKVKLYCYLIANLTGYICMMPKILISRIIQKEPTPDMLPGLNDKIMIGIPYEQIDLVLLSIENCQSPENISKITGIEFYILIVLFYN